MTGDKNDQEAAARLERARALGSTGEARTLYRDWARDYDADVFGRLKVTGTRRIAELLVEHLPQAPDTRIIDLGCGTGAAGAVLKSHGLTTIDGLDLSPEMLLIAADCGAYRLLIAADLLAPLPLRDHRYDAAISAGTFTTGHVGAAALPAIHRLIRPGGLLACVIARSFYESGGFADAIQRLVSDRRWRILHDTLEPIRDGGPPEGHMLVFEIG
ncbi:MAG TPA: methyltransferase domain-containing protein [Aestuariivirgaceae bacterium]|jgi:predicted TPR repeat methyltransferase|nr:methyltransferase domain-containing protein [Aestuariivirgaceae bacterium]